MVSTPIFSLTSRISAGIVHSGTLRIPGVGVGNPRGVGSPFLVAKVSKVNLFGNGYSCKQNRYRIVDHIDPKSESLILPSHCESPARMTYRLFVSLPLVASTWTLDNQGSAETQPKPSCSIDTACSHILHVRSRILILAANRNHHRVVRTVRHVHGISSTACGKRAPRRSSCSLASCRRRAARRRSRAVGAARSSVQLSKSVSARSSATRCDIPVAA